MERLSLFKALELIQNQNSEKIVAYDPNTTNFLIFDDLDSLHHHIKINKVQINWDPKFLDILSDGIWYYVTLNEKTKSLLDAK